MIRSLDNLLLASAGVTWMEMTLPPFDRDLPSTGDPSKLTENSHFDNFPRLTTHVVEGMRPRSAFTKEFFLRKDGRRRF